MPTMQIDPIIAEVRAVREEHAARFEYDVKAMFRDIRAMQESSGREYVRYPARRVSASESASPNQAPMAWCCTGEHSSPFPTRYGATSSPDIGC